MEKADSAELALPYKLLASYPSGLSRAQVEVIFDKSYDRIPHPDINLENSINEIWDQRVQRNASLYNGEKFRSLYSMEDLLIKVEMDPIKSHVYASTLD
ncbi:hypothetical protein SLEP1_g19864 [Rubroshorea leprosula]|uniref:Uncharacterized protein n=1 Tax=Rubroshorea leprosula TaxID=152421 RepID=A0AAV5JA03_9ROSI|nr:hypothetical protein SLEP1_g19864 [Rubroshorea leprosula]